ncbi:tetratricopeptide repeat protein [Actinosynnema sp. NPDC050801]|uniref:tetratricopeptide repeat protein n=1 Tax=unclassified Actinosynnema TaxID=2637065 RepID=UPI0033CE052E
MAGMKRHALHRTMVLVDVERFGASTRTLHHQLDTREGLYAVVAEALVAAGVPWDACHHEDRGDGLFLLVPPQYPKAPLVEVLPEALARAVRGYNNTSHDAAKVRLRLAVHAGEVAFDQQGATSTALTSAFRLLDTASLKEALAGSPGVLAMVVSRLIFDDVVRHCATLDPATFRPIQAVAKEFRDLAWIALPDHPYPPDVTVLAAQSPSHVPPGATSDDHAVDPGLRYLEELAAKDEPPAVEVEDERTPFDYLDPRRRVVGFLHRPELDRLEEWCRSATTRRMRLVCGPGGAGKTRLSVELVHRVRRMPGWTAIRVRRTDVDLNRLVPALEGRKVLLCLEDGEEWAYDLSELLKTKQQTHLRVLLLARTYGAWWGRLLSTEGQVVNPEETNLSPLAEEFDRLAILRRAYQDFRAEIAPNAPEEAPPVLVNAAPDATNALELLGAALAVVLHLREHDGRPPEGEIRLKDSLVHLLGHQRRWWESWVRTTHGDNAPADGRDFSSRVLLLPALYLAADREQAKLALEQVFAGCGLDPDLPGSVADALARVWPPPQRAGIQQYWDALRPDRLGETLVLEVLHEARDEESAAGLISRVFRAGADEAQAEHALTVLIRAEQATTDEQLRRRVRACVRSLLEDAPEAFLPAGVSVAAGLTEPGSLVDLIQAAAAHADELALRRAAVAVPQSNNALAHLEAHLWRRRAELLLREHSRSLTVSQRVALAEQHRWQAHAHMRAEENTSALDAVRQSVEYYSAVVVTAGRGELAEDYAGVLELAADAATRAGMHEDALRYSRHSTDLYRDLDEDGAIQRTLRAQGSLLQEMGRQQEATEVLEEATRHGLAYKSQIDKWFSELLPPTGNQAPRTYEGPRPAPDNPAMRVVLPVGHFAGPLYTSPDAAAPESFEVRFRHGIFSLSAAEYAVWAVSHGDPSLLGDPADQVPNTREVVEYAARMAGVTEPEPVFDSLVEDGLLVHTELTGEPAREFARRHRVVPLVLGLGNSPQNPVLFQIGMPDAPRATVAYDIYHLWLFTHRAPNLWDALVNMGKEAEQSNAESDGVELVSDPDVLLETALGALRVLVSTSCAYVDRCD